MTYTPDRWCMLKHSHKGKAVYRVLASWYGGYLDGDSWKLNSGCTGVRQAGDYLLFDGISGSTYRCHKDAYGMSRYTSGVYQGFCEQAKASEGKIIIDALDSKTDFLQLDYAEVS